MHFPWQNPWLNEAFWYQQARDAFIGNLMDGDYYCKYYSTEWNADKYFSGSVNLSALGISE